jgi:hypothetical protein
MPIASGTFEVKITREPPYDTEGGITLGRARVDKIFAGDLVGTAVAQLTNVRTGVIGSQAHVAIDRVTCALAGKRGSFVLLHAGIVDRGALSLACTIVPDTGTDGLAAIRGSLRIDAEGGAYRYDLDYTLAG